MAYVIVDPKLLLIESPDNPVTKASLAQFLGFIIHWSTAARNHAITFGLSRECVNILKHTTRNVFSTDRMTEVVEKLMPNNNPEDIFRLLDPFLTHLLNDSHLEPMKLALEEHLMLDIEPASHNVLLSPPELLNELPYDLADAFRRMVGHITFASRNLAKPLDSLSEIYMLTPADLQQLGTDGNVFVNLNYSWVLGDGIDPSLENNTNLMETITGISPDADLSYILKPINYKTVEEAVTEAGKRFPNKLIITRKALETAQSSGYPKPIKVYKALCGLVEQWLPAYQLKDKHYANDQYYEHLRYEISIEGERVRQKPNLRSQREVTHNGDIYFVEDHVKMETGPNAVRIYFMPIEENGQTQLLIARAGIHPDTGRGY